MKNKVSLTIVALAGMLTSSFATITIWTDGGGGDQDWNNSANWNNGIPISSSYDAQIGNTQPSGNAIGVNNGGASITIGSLTFTNTLTAGVDITLFSPGDALQINGAITNNSGFTDSFSLPVAAGGSAVWTGPLDFASNVAIGVNTVTLANAINFTAPSSLLSFDVNSAITYGKFAGAGVPTIDGALAFNFNYSPAVAPTTWDFISQSAAGSLSGGVSLVGAYSATFTETAGIWDATTGAGPTLLTWQYTASTGVLTVVPEPTTWALLAGSLTTVMVFRRRRSQG